MSELTEFSNGLEHRGLVTLSLDPGGPEVWNPNGKIFHFDPLRDFLNACKDGLESISPLNQGRYMRYIYI